MEGYEGLWRFAVIALAAIAAGALVGILLGGANSDPFETVVTTVSGERRTVTKTETETVTKTKTETVTADEGITGPVDAAAGKKDDADGDRCSDSYVGACVDPSGGLIDCTMIGDQDFTSVGRDPYGLDPDQDGVACESQ